MNDALVEARNELEANLSLVENIFAAKGFGQVEAWVRVEVPDLIDYHWMGFGMFDDRLRLLYRRTKRGEDTPRNIDAIPLFQSHTLVRSAAPSSLATLHEALIEARECELLAAKGATEKAAMFVSSLMVSKAE